MVTELTIGKLAELRRAVADFRKTGKKTYAYMEDGSAMEYLVASSCDVVAMPESGTLMLIGLRAGGPARSRRTHGQREARRAHRRR